MAPFAGEAAGPRDDPAVNDEAAAHACAQNGAEDDAMAASRTFDRLGQREAIGIVGDEHRPAEPVSEFRGEAPPVDTGNVGAFDDAGAGIDDTGDGDGDGSVSPRRGP